jgi:hypothetical protein
MSRRWAVLVLPLALACGAAPEEEVGDLDDESVVPEGKEHSFYSDSAREYFVTRQASRSRSTQRTRRSRRPPRPAG